MNDIEFNCKACELYFLNNRKHNKIVNRVCQKCSAIIPDFKVATNNIDKTIQDLEHAIFTVFDIGKEGGDFTVELTSKIENGIIEVLDCKRYKYKKEHELLKNSFKPKPPEGKL